MIRFALLMAVGAALAFSQNRPQIRTDSLPEGRVGAPYLAVIDVRGGDPPYTWAVTEGQLPPGLGFVPFTGAIAGVPTTPGDYSFRVRVQDRDERDDQANLQIRIVGLVGNNPPSIQTQSLPGGTVGAAYTASVTATGGTPPYSFAVTGGALPAGLTLASNGAISGTPTAAGASPFTVRVTDNANQSSTRDLAITIAAAPSPPTISAAQPPAGTVGQPYSGSLAASGGTPPYTWTVSAGSLPAGLSLAANGSISGTPTAAGASTFTARVTDSANQSATRDFQITIAAPAVPPTISASQPPTGTAGQPYSASLSATGGTAPYTWTVSAGALPAGLNLSAEGTITGTPTTAGTSTFTARVTDARNQSATRDFQITIAAAPVPPTISTATLAGGTVGQAYSATVSATGGTPPFTWTVSGGTLPAGLNMSADGAITGTPTTAGTSTFTARVTDSRNQSATRDLQITIAAAPVPPTITTTTLAGGTVGQAYSATVSATGGTPPYTWTVSGGALPAGLNMSAEGVITGTPTTAGTSTFTARVTDSRNQSATRDFQITIAAAPVPPTISTATLAGGTVGQAYSATVSATGGTPPYTWTVSGGALPAGLNMSAEGIITGTPTTAGTSTFTARVTDSRNQSATRDFQITITAAPVPPTITTTSLSGGTVGQVYSATLGASGGTPPYTWTVSAGSLPAGLTMNSNGVVTGTPTAAGTSTFTARLTDSRNQSATRDFQITIAAAVAAPSITTSSLPGGSVGAEYGQNLSATGGRPPYAWSVSSGALPPGVSLSGAGRIAGTPTAPGNYSFAVRVSDADARTAERALAIAVGPALTISACPVGTGLIGTNYSAGLAATGGVAPYLWSITSGQLPPGLSLASASGLISGSPVLAGAFTFTVNASDANSRATTRECTITIGSPLRVLTEALPDATTTARYLFTLAATGGTPPYVWTPLGGTLPPGLSLDTATGTITGQPTQPGRFNVAVRVSDAAGASAERTYTLGVATGITIPSCPPVSASVGRPYEATLGALGGQAPYTWSVLSGTLPEGLSLSPQGSISGTPLTAGGVNFTLRASDPAGASTDRGCSIQVLPELLLTTQSLPGAEVGASYTGGLQATGGSAPYNWNITAGSLPGGLTLNSSTGQITGTPAAAGVFRFTARVSDSAGNQRERQFEITVGGGFVITACPTPTAIIGEDYSSAPSLSGGQAPLTWAIASGTLPAGLSLSAASGAIAGAATTAGTSDFTLRVTDGSSRSTTRACSINVNPSALRLSATGRLTDAVLGTPYTETLQAVGGRGPYAWSLVDGALPPGVTLGPNGSLSGSPSTSGIYRFTVRVADADRGLASGILEVRVVPGRTPNLSFGDLPDIVAPAQQPRVQVRIDAPYPAELKGRVQLRFAPDPGLNVDDPSITFVDGSRAMDFTIPAGSTEAVFPVPQNALQTGSVAGVINLDATLSTGDIDVTPTPTPAKALRVDRTAPVISSVRLNPVSGGFEVIVTGLSTTREVTTATFQFTTTNGTRLDPSQVTVQTEAAARQWFGDSRSSAFGGQFTFTQPFTVQNATVSEVTVTLTNGQGTSQPARARF